MRMKNNIQAKKISVSNKIAESQKEYRKQWLYVIKY